MKTATTWLAVWCITNACPAQQAPDVQMPKVYASGTQAEEESESYNAPYREFIAHERGSDSSAMKGVVFSAESVSISEPSDRLLFEHELNVDNFLSTPGKFGIHRIRAIHMSNPRLATHGGVLTGTSLATHGDVLRGPEYKFEGWNAGGHMYHPSGPWGMIGDLDQQQPKAYLFRPSPFLRQQDRKDETTKKEPKAEESELNHFEEHAVAMLRKGEKLVRWENERTMHAVGAVRAEMQCLRCHEGRKPGDLLGAFTYSFTKAKAEQFDEKTVQILKLHDQRKTTLEIAEAVGLLKPPAEAESPLDKAFATNRVQQALLVQGIVTAEMLAEQALRRKILLEMDLGPVKKPKASAGAE